ncbi:histidine kinase [Paraburkholderia kururiensis]|uniref:hybrid sensor histidine kinase/response regulator n=1 Tax=Paraburkholderia kururiensis TaxID=984307 RepID=UPI0039A4BB8B
MDTQAGKTFADLANWLERKRWLITRRWLRLVRSDPAIENTGRLTNAQLIDYLPQVFDEVCQALRAAVPQASYGQVERDARQHGKHRWQHGYQLDALFRELDLLQKCTQQATREFFAHRAHRDDTQPRAHQLIEDLFSAMIYGAIRQLLEEQNQRVNDSLRARDFAFAAQQDSEERLRIAAAAAGLGIFEWDVETGEAVWENARMYEITGQRPEDGPMSSEEFFGCVHPEDLEELVSEVRADDVPGRQVNALFRLFRRNDGALRFLEMCGSFRYAPEGDANAFIGTLADVTDRKSVEDALREVDRRKDAFLATLAHELRNPLAPIRNAAWVLKRSEAELPPQARWVPGVVDRQIRHLSSLIDDLLEVSRITTGKITLKRRVFDLREAVAGALEINAPHAEERHHRIAVSMPDAPVYVDADVTRITQIVSNLVDNALKYTPEGGDIRVAVRAEGRGEGERALIEVSDTGIGISATELPHVFELFVQAEDRPGRAVGGLGIGLSVVRTLAEMHGGEAIASSAGINRGSHFRIRLPVAQAGAVAAVTEPAAPQASARRPLRVVIVDDNRDAAESLAMVLDMHEVRTAADADEAIERVSALSPVDVVLLDIGLPGMDGYTLARRLRELPGTGGTAFVALTGSGRTEDIARSRSEGFAEHLVKPVDPLRVIELLDSLGAATREREGSEGHGSGAGQLDGSRA